MEEDIRVKTRDSEVLEVIKYVCIMYGVFLFLVGAIQENQEAVIQVTFIMVFAIIVDVLNNGECIVYDKGIKTNNIGFIRYKDIYRLELHSRTLILYTRKENNIYRINFARNEDMLQISKIYKYIDAKVKRVTEDIKDHEDYIREFSN